jgi:hypothetical protein
MGPSGRGAAAEPTIGARLADAASSERQGGARALPVEMLATIVSSNLTASPISKLRAAAIRIDLVERVTSGGQVVGHGMAPEVHVLVGSLVLGDLLVLRDGFGDELTLVVRRTQLAPLGQEAATPLDVVPAELVAVARAASGGGVLCYREHFFSEGDQVRFKAFVEPQRRAVSHGDGLVYVARDDLGPVILEEVFVTPAF